MSIVLGFFVYMKGREHSINKIWAFFCLSVSLWSLGLGMMADSQTEAAALFWLKYVHYIGAIFIPILFLHFSLVLLGIDKERTKLIRNSYYIACLFVLFNFSGALATVKPLPPFNYYTAPGIAYPLYALMFFSYVLYALITIFKTYNKLTGQKKTQLKYFFFAMAIGFLGGSTAFFPVFGLPLFPFGMYFASVYAIVTTYAILRYNLMAIDVIFERSTVYALMIASVTTIYLSTIFVIENYLMKFIGYSSLIARLIAALVIALTFLPLRTRIETLIDRVFFRTKYEYLGVLRNFTDRLVMILELRRLMQTIVDNIGQILQVEYVALMLYDPKTHEYQTKASVGFESDVRDVSFKHDALMIQHLKSRLKFKHQMAQKSKILEEKAWGFPTLAEQMDMFKAELFIPLFFSEKLIAVLTLSEKKSGEYYSSSELRLLKTLANQAAIALSNAMSYDELKKNLLGTIEALSTAIEAKDVYTRGHSERVVKIAVEIAKEMSVSRDEIDILRYAGMLHDIGKIAIDDSILQKATSLTPDELNKIMDHPEIGENIIAPIKFLDDVRQIIRNHHERWDGRGYPDRLNSDRIPVLSRILAVADAFDAMTSARSYRPARDTEKALDELIKCSGTQFDPVVIDAFAQAHKKGNIQ